MCKMFLAGKVSDGCELKELFPVVRFKRHQRETSQCFCQACDGRTLGDEGNLESERNLSR